MSTQQISLRRPSIRLSITSFAAPFLICAALLSPSAYAQRVALASRALVNGNADTGQVPASQPITITLRLAPTPERAAALQQLLTAQITPTSPSYHRWLTPQEFATSYGATDDQLATVTTWAQSQGLTISAVSPSHTRITITGSVDAVQRAFATSLHNYTVSGLAQPRVAAATTPTIPATLAPVIAGVSGLDSLPAVTARVLTTAANGRVTVLSTVDSDPLTDAATAIDANTAPILTLDTSACSGTLSQSDLDTYQALLQQANAQGITILATSTCTTADGTTSQPNALLSLPEITALTISPATSDSTLTVADLRPGWQTAPGLPADALRHQPDLSTTSTTAFSQTINAIDSDAGTRQGNINAVLYSLAATPKVYTQSDISSDVPDTWESATGLGTVDLTILAKVFPRATGAISTTTSLISNNYNVTYGTGITLTSKVLPSSYGSSNPSGTVTFTVSGQSLGSATIDSAGNAALTLTTALNVGANSITANYSGDSIYSASTSPAIGVYVSIANATITATAAPSSNVPYGSTVTVTATVALTGAASPSGTVSATVQGVTGASATATLTPNPGGNTATANINLNAPKPQSGTYSAQVTCAGNANFQCQSPANVTFTTAKGYTTTTISLSPAAPQAGQPVTITATVNNNGNGTDTYTFSGSITFTDTTTNRTIATVPVGTNGAATSATLSGNVQHNIIATYSGDAYWNGSTSTAASVTPTLLPSTLTIVSNVNSSLVGANVIITATVFTTVSNSVGPTGTITFYDTFNNSIVQLGGTSSQFTLTPNGPNQSIARFTTTGLLAGLHSIYAIYNGDANFSSATSSTMPINITDFNITMIPQTLTLKAGQSGQVVMLVGLIGGFEGSISFGCTPPAGAEATCSFSPASLQGGGSTTMTIVTTAAKAATTKSARNGARGGPWSLGAGSTLAALLCFALPRRRRAMPLLLSSLLALALIPGLGCGLGGTAPTNSSSSSQTADPGTPLGTQNFTITAAGNDGVSTARHNYQYQVTVQ